MSPTSPTAETLSSGLAASRSIGIVPKPVRLVPRSGAFELSPRTVVVSDPAVAAESAYLREFVARATGYELPAVETADGDRIVLAIVPEADALGSEGYRLIVGESGVAIAAATSAGVFQGIQTLLQLLPPAVFAAANGGDRAWPIPCVEIEDRPRFGWRGAMIDVGRYFFPVEFIKKFIDLLAMHKLNILHLHLTEDQGWRLEIKKYPRLTEVGAFRKETLTRHLGPNKGSHLLPGNGIPHGGFYTQDEAREIVEYARIRHITVVPEIELPGHARAAIAAYPELGCLDEPVEVGKSWGPHEDVFNPSERTFEFLQDVLTEVLDIFPSRFIHIGGDEVIKDYWKASAFCQERMEELGLKDEDELQSYFIRRMDQFLTARGRRLIGWDEILQGGLAPNATVMSWRGEAGGIAAAEAGHDVIMSPESNTYLDLYQSRDTASEPVAIGGYLPLSKAYSYDPVPKDLREDVRRHVLGAQGQLWTEYVPTPEHAEYMAFPRLSALAEAMWTEPGAKDWDDFGARLPEHLSRLAAAGVRYRDPSRGE